MISNNVMLDALQSDHTTLEGLKMLVLTWNVNAKLEESPNLRKLFFREEEQCFGGTPEVVVLGLQEMVELSTSNVIGGSMVGNAAERVEQWRAMLLTTLKERDVTFEMVTSKNMVGLWITVFSLRSFKQHISKVQVSQLGRGVGGVLGNKGAVYARFNIKDTSICLVCAHFAAHRENLHKRNEDFHAILSHKAFPGLLDNPSSTEYKNLSQHNSIHMTTEAARCERMLEKISLMKQTLASKRIAVSPPLDVKKEQLANYTSAKDHDVIIWLGDLNYRLLGGMENSRIYDIIDGKRSYALLNMDQLNIEKDKNTVFQGFHEGLISFDPTYKYSPGTPNYNRERCPAWCDRILWKLRKADIDVEIFRDLDSYVSTEHQLLSKKSAEKSTLSTSTATVAEPVASAAGGENVQSAPSPLNNNSAKTVDTANTTYTVDSMSTITELGEYSSTTLTSALDADNSNTAVVTRENSAAQETISASAKTVGIADCGSSVDDASLLSPLTPPSAVVSPDDSDVNNCTAITNSVVDSSTIHVNVVPISSATDIDATSGDNNGESTPSSDDENDGDEPGTSGAEATADTTYFGSDNEGTASSAESDTESVVLNTDASAPISTSKTPRSEKGPRKPKYRSFRSLPPMPEIRSSVHLVPEARVTEIVELMVYNRGENIISDHKPVRALLGVKFKRYVLLLFFWLLCGIQQIPRESLILQST